MSAQKRAIKRLKDERKALRGSIRRRAMKISKYEGRQKPGDTDRISKEFTRNNAAAMRISELTNELEILGSS